MDPIFQVNWLFLTAEHGFNDAMTLAWAVVLLAALAGSLLLGNA